MRVKCDGDHSAIGILIATQIKLAALLNRVNINKRRLLSESRDGGVRERKLSCNDRAFTCESGCA